MKLIRYHRNGTDFWGHLDGEAVGGLSGDIFGEFLRGPRVAALGEVALLAPVQPGKIVGVANNFADRLRETGQPVPELPNIFLRPPTTAIGPEAVIRLPPQSERVEYGAELAVVIGRRARWVTTDEAAAHILGYTCANDITARDLVEQDGARARGKSFDTFCPLGPCLATGLDLADVLITCKVNGETRQMSSTRDMLFTVPQLVAFISSIMTLLPGDVILTGSPAGVDTLSPGDVVEVEIEGIGALRNPVEAETH